jgi:Fur family transcriptional regulator, ferric uptake regulator
MPLIWAIIVIATSCNKENAMSCAEHLSTPLRKQGFRLTSQRMTILHVLNQDGGHLTPSQVYIRARQSLPGITEPTVYRTLEFLADNHLAMAAHVGSGKLVYEIAGHDHHHLICRACGKSVEMDHAALSRAYRQMGRATGYKQITSHTTFFGLCPACQE